MAGFPTTRWSLILAAPDGDAARRQALEALLPLYWKPVYFYVRRKGLSVEDAEDAVQGLFLRLLERDPLHRLDPARGRFRSYLKTTADHYLADRHEQQAAHERGGEYRIVPVDLALAERELSSSVPEAPEAAFDREWAIAVMERAVARLKQEFDEGKLRGRADTVLRFFGVGEAPSYAEAAVACGMSVPQLKATLHRAHERFRELVREEVAATVESERVEQEVAELARLLAP